MPLDDPFRSHTPRSIFNGLLWFLLPVGMQLFSILGTLLLAVPFVWCNRFLMYSCILCKTGVIFNLCCLSVAHTYRKQKIIIRNNHRDNVNSSKHLINKFNTSFLRISLTNATTYEIDKLIKT
jgi:hypothetical protein